VRTLGRFFRTHVTLLEEHRLVTDGPYRVLRNPAYTGTLATLAGLGLMQGYAFSLAAAVGPPLAAFAWRIRVEERALAERFGPAWEAWRRRTWALLPPVW
jgi:protein-S-isoprenylcysteine O-methyltransferase